MHSSSLSRLFFFVVMLSPLLGCKRKASTDECAALVAHYAELVVREAKPDASPEVVLAEKAREQREAQSDEAFRNCPTEVSAEELACALRAQTTNAVLRCLE